MALETQTTSASLNAHAHDISRTARRVTRLEYFVMGLIVLEVLTIFMRLL
jgi:hypothetical protein